jgi:2-polyprenyl-6-methoxyphenol hydroxylase-like FAD-dependent oxidoreductase
MTHTRTALVIGGGIAGPATAMALQKAGIDPVVYEAHPTGADGIGVFLTLGSNGVDALRVLGADKPAVAAGFPTPGITLRSGTGKHLGVSRTGHSLPDGTTSQTLKRADLYRVLHEEASSRGVRVEHGKRLVGAEETGAGVRAIFADGSEAVGAVLIGCDGVHSTVRRIIDPGAPAPTYSGLITTGGYARGVQVDTEPGSYEMIFGKRAFFGYAMAPDGEVWWFANVPRRDEPARGEVESIGGDEWRHRLLALYAEDAGPAVRLIEATPDLMAMSPIHAIPHLPAWHNGRMIVIGDAAHAPSPSSGQGASLSIEDAVVLAKCLRDLPSPPAAFAPFEAARRPRVERIIKWAARINNSKAHMQTYDHHVDWDAPTPAPA